MHIVDALRASKVGRAQRKTKDGRLMVAHGIRKVRIQKAKPIRGGGFIFRDARCEEHLGYNDWGPV